MKLLLTLAVLAVVILALVEAHPGRGRGRPGGQRGVGGRPGGQRGGGRHSFGGFGGRSRGDRRPRGGLIACRREGANGTALEQEDCPEEYQCQNGPLDVTIEGAANKIYFCNTPFPTLKMACKVEATDGTELKSRNCSEGNQCTAGPYEATDRRTNTTVNFYICVPTGSSGNPTEPNYAQALLRGACSIDGTAQPERTCRDAECDGVKVTVAGQEAQFCKGPENDDDDFEYLDLFGKCGKRRGSHGRRDSSSADDDSSSAADDDDDDETAPEVPPIPERFQAGGGRRQGSGGRDRGRGGPGRGGPRGGSRRGP